MGNRKRGSYALIRTLQIEQTVLYQQILLCEYLLKPKVSAKDHFNLCTQENPKKLREVVKSEKNLIKQ